MRDSILTSSSKRVLNNSLRLLSQTGDMLHTRRNEAPILISGSPRGGTTWVAESIAHAYRSTRLLWEPLQDGNPDREGIGFSKRPWVNEDTTDEQIDDFFRRLILGKQINSHLLRLRKKPGNLYTLFSNKRLIIKFVRGNGVVAYLRRRFGIPRPLIIIRHPCAVVASQLRMGNWEDHPHINEHMTKMLPELHRILATDRTLPERLAITWAGDVLAAKESLRDAIVLHYEDLVKYGSSAFAPAFNTWGSNAPPESLNNFLAKASSTAHDWSSLKTIDGKLGRWKEDLDNDTINKILLIAHSLGVEEYTWDIFPDKRIENY